MADEEEVQEEANEGEQPEIVTLEEGQVAPPEQSEELPEEFKGLTPKQMAERIKQLEGKLQETGNTSNALKEGIAALGETLQRQNTNTLPPPAAEEPFDKVAWGKKLFEDGDAAFNAVDELVTKKLPKKVAEQFAPLLQQFNKQALKMAENNVRMDPVNGPIYKEYEAEIKKEIGKLPAEQQNNPEVYEYMVNQMKIRHFDDLVQRAASTEGAAGARPNASPPEGASRAQRPAAAQTARASTPFFSEPVSGASGAGGKRRVYMTPQQKQELEFRALATGTPLEILVANFEEEHRR